MINIYHEGLCGKELKHKIGASTSDFSDLKPVYKLIMDYLEGKGIHPNYLRSWTRENGHIIIDYGSHAKFIVLEEVNHENT